MSIFKSNDGVFDSSEFDLVSNLEDVVHELGVLAGSSGELNDDLDGS